MLEEKEGESAAFCTEIEDKDESLVTAISRFKKIKEKYK